MRSQEPIAQRREQRILASRAQAAIQSSPSDNLSHNTEIPNSPLPIPSEMTGPSSANTGATTGASGSAGGSQSTQSTRRTSAPMPTRKMPKPGEKNAPTFDTEKPEELGRFFERIEDWFADEGIDADTDRKRRIVRYLDTDSEAQWKALSTFEQGTYLEFKAQVLAAYPKAEDVMRGSVSALRKKVKRIGPVAPDERDDLLQLIRIMTAEVVKLKNIEPPIHTNRELVDLFLGRLTPEFAARVANKLSVRRLLDVQKLGDNPVAAARNTEDMYDVDEVMEMAKHTSLEHANPFGKYLGVVSGQNSEVSVKLEEAVARLTDTIHLQVQHNKSVDQRLASMQSYMSTPAQAPVRQGYGQGSAQNNALNALRLLLCFYCRGEHTINDCVLALRHLDLNWIKKIDGRMRMPDGQKIYGTPGQSMYEVIESLHKNLPGVIPVSKIADKSAMYQGAGNVTSYVQNQAQEEDPLRILTELIQKIGVGRLEQLLTEQPKVSLEDEVCEQNFD